MVGKASVHVNTLPTLEEHVFEPRQPQHQQQHAPTTTAPPHHHNRHSHSTVLSDAQAWSALYRHAREEMASVRLPELCRDTDRVSALVAVHATEYRPRSMTLQHVTPPVDCIHQSLLLADLSRQHWTQETVTHLLTLATARQIPAFVQDWAWGPLRRHSRGPTAATASEGTNSRTTRFASPQKEKDESEQEAAYSMHMALRVPKDIPACMLAPSPETREPTNVLPVIHQEWARLEEWSTKIRSGVTRGATGSMIRNVVVVGKGVPLQALAFVHGALKYDERANWARRFGLQEGAGLSLHASRLRRQWTQQSGAGTSNSNSGSGGANHAHYYAQGAARQLFLVSSMDPIAAAEVVADLDPAATLVVSVALQGNEETGLATQRLKAWLLNGLANSKRPEVILSKHMILVTGNERIAAVINKPESVYLVPFFSRCEPFTSTTAATLVPLSIVYGWPLVQEFLAGAHDMDTHFSETNPRHNLPILLALADTWNDVFLGSQARAIVPAAAAWANFWAFCAALESQTMGQSSDVGPASGCSSLIVNGRLDGALDRSFYQSGNVMNSELVVTLDTQLHFNTSRVFGTAAMEDVYSAQDSLMCSIFAHADELAFGNHAQHAAASQQADPIGPPPTMPLTPLPKDVSPGNRPSMLLIAGKLDAFMCGQLIALSEHRAAVKAHLWGLDPCCRNVGSSLRLYRTDLLRDELLYLFEHPPQEDDDDQEAGNHPANVSLSTRTILGHYASLQREERQMDRASA